MLPLAGSPLVWWEGGVCYVYKHVSRHMSASRDSQTQKIEKCGNVFNFLKAKLGRKFNC